MSLNEMPVCASCRNLSSELSISCTECLQVCCSACFSGLVGATVKANVDTTLQMARICRKCQMKDGQATNGGASTAKRPADQEVCPLHGRKRRLYCFNCSEGICGDCIELEEPHELHQVGNLAAMYQEKAFSFEVKLIRAEKNNDTGAAVFRKNLKLVEKQENLVLTEIDALTENSKLQVSRITAERKEVLKEKLNIPAVNGETLADLRHKAKQLSPYEFLQQIPKFENKCDELIAQKNDFTLQKFDDIRCDLIPQYLLRKIVYPGFQNAADDNAQFTRLKAAYDIEWKFTIKKAHMLQVEPKANDPEIQTFRHMMVVTILHPDFSKTINKSFELDGRNTQFDVVPSSYLVDQGFCNKASGNLEMWIGIRCLNLLIEKQLLNYRYCQVRDHLAMYFCPKPSDLIVGKVLRSCQLKDDRNRCWCLMMQLTSEYVGCYVELKNGFPVCSNIFIELKHTDPSKTIILLQSKHKFVRDAIDWGWSNFIKLDTLKNDAGYHPDGILHFRFGVRPLPSLAETSAPSAANA